MRSAMGDTYSRAGILKRSGKGIVMDIAGTEYYLIAEDLTSLMSNQMADVVNYVGETEGLAWLSPLNASKKLDMTTLINRHIYVVPYRGVDRVINGGQRNVLIKEYHPVSQIKM